MKLPVIVVEPRSRPDACESAPSQAERPQPPGSQGKYYVHTWGCQMNFHDSEKLAGQLESLGYAQAATEDDADVVLLNTCSVREKADVKAFSALGALKKLKKKNPDAVIGVAGCVAQQLKREFFQKAPHLDLVLGPQAINHLPRHIELVRKKRVRVLDTVQHRAFQDYAGPLVRRGEPPKAWITVQEGCDKMCTYCIIPHTRGREVNRAYRSIIDETRHLVDQGFVEIELLGQNVNCWFEEAGGGRRDFADLLLGVADVEGVERVRFITSHPSHFSDRIISAMAEHPALCPHVHLPAQSGSDKVLEGMRRGYTREQFLERALALRAAVPEVAISSDIIVGFCGETEDDHERTLELLQLARFDFIYSFIYSPRPHSRAWEWMSDVPKEVASRRLQEVQTLQNEMQWEIQRECEGRVYPVLVDGSSRMDDGKICGRTPHWRVVNFVGDAALHGKTVPVQIEKAHLNSLSGIQVG